jgi:predicted  nucleic acid-binding Zn-ribbon protein
LLEKGYFNSDGSLNVANLRDLLNQALRVFRKKREGDYFACGVIELPSGGKQKIFIAQNESGRYTVMLPEDY